MGAKAGPFTGVARKYTDACGHVPTGSTTKAVPHGSERLGPASQ
jgi:hypothetical protein